MKRFLYIVFSLLLVGMLNAQIPGLKLHYAFNLHETDGSIVDETGSGRNASLNGSAAVRKLGTFGIVETGSTAGYVQMNASVGQIVATLTDFSIATYVYVDPVQSVTSAGNFIWTFGNSQNMSSAANGSMFFTAKETRYAISPTNWTTEQKVNVASAIQKGSWKHVAYVQSGNTGTVYVDGVSRKTGTVSMKPSELGETAYNFLFKSPYASDAFLLNSKLCDFRVYDVALTPAQLLQLASSTNKLDTLLFNEQVQQAALALDPGDLTSVKINLSLPETGINSTTVAWTSSNQARISNAGVVTRPAAGSQAVQVTLTATITKEFVSQQRDFTATVIPQLTDQQSADADAQSIVLPANAQKIRTSIVLPVSGAEGSTITWTSMNTQMLSNQGVVVSRPPFGSGDIEIVLQALVKKNNTVQTRNFTVKVAEDEGYAGYLFAYFTGNNISQEAIRFGWSTNGLAYKALNNNQPVISSAVISLTGGIRDPHILRGEDGWFYMVVTDMVSANGWSSNRGMVLLKSRNLTDWSSATVHIPTAFAADFANVDRVWAPQTIYDPEVGKYMVYFSMRKGSSDYDKIYYAYANSSFTALETVPQQLFYNPAMTACIDGDIVFHEGKYHLFFKTEGTGNGIKKAVSEKLTGDWVVLDKYLQQTTSGVEGSCVFRLYNSDNWVLMYDVYTAGYYQFTQSTDLENFSVIGAGVSMDFSPRHGTIIPLTSSELQAVRIKWDPTVDVPVTKADQLRVFKTPEGQVKVTFPDNINSGKLSVYNLHGQCVHSQQLNNSTESNFQLHGKGVFLLRVEGEDGSRSTSFISE